MTADSICRTSLLEMVPSTTIAAGGLDESSCNCHILVGQREVFYTNSTSLSMMSHVCWGIVSMAFIRVDAGACRAGFISSISS